MLDNKNNIITGAGSGIGRATSLQRLERAALLSPGTIAVHATGLDQEDLDLLRQREVTLVHTPQSDLVNRREHAPLSVFAGGALGTAEFNLRLVKAER